MDSRLFQVAVLIAALLLLQQLLHCMLNMSVVVISVCFDVGSVIPSHELCEWACDLCLGRFLRYVGMCSVRAKQ